MKTKITLTNNQGVNMLGTDGNFTVDGRFGLERIREEVRAYRNRFKKHFTWKYEYWTHFTISNSFQTGSHLKKYPI